jgi:hypothetical protein
MHRKIWPEHGQRLKDGGTCSQQCRVSIPFALKFEGTDQFNLLSFSVLAKKILRSRQQTETRTRYRAAEIERMDLGRPNPRCRSEQSKDGA